MSTNDQLRVSVVVCTRDRAEHLDRALGGLSRQEFTGFEVIVIDQSRTDETRTVVNRFESSVPGLRYFHVRQAGLSRAYNRAIRESRADVVAFTDDDCLVPPQWIQTVWDSFARSPHVDVIYGQVLAPPEYQGTPTEALIPLLPIGHREELNRSHGFRVFGMAANFAARRGKVDAIGGFDEVLGGGGPLQSTQDFDFAYRIFGAGGTILLDPELIAYHYGIRPLDDWPGLMRSYGVGTGGFYGKHLRLRDGRALRLFTAAAYRAVGEAVKATALRRPDARHKQQFVAGLLTGVRKSFEFPIDTSTRLYRSRVPAVGEGS